MSKKCLQATRQKSVIYVILLGQVYLLGRQILTWAGAHSQAGLRCSWSSPGARGKLTCSWSKGMFVTLPCAKPQADRWGSLDLDLQNSRCKTGLPVEAQIGAAWPRNGVRPLGLMVGSYLLPPSWAALPMGLPSFLLVPPSFCLLPFHPEKSLHLPNSAKMEAACWLLPATCLDWHNGCSNPASLMLGQTYLMVRVHQPRANADHILWHNPKMPLDQCTRFMSAQD